MSDDSGQDKTHEATPKRRRDAAKKGQVPRSQEVTTAFLLLAAAGSLLLLTGGTARSLVDVFRMSASSMDLRPGDPFAVSAYVQAIVLRAFQGLAPILLSLAVVALAVAGAQGRGNISSEALNLQWDRLNPLKKAKQIWGWKAVAELVKSFLKLLIVGSAVYLAIGSAMGTMGGLSQTSPYALLEFMNRYTVRMMLSAGLAYLALALGDYAFQVWRHEKQLRMTREEVKRETKETEGDQVMKVRRRSMARQMARKRMLADVPDADVVVTNPTHIAVALKYDPDKAHAPVVVAMGERLVAQRIKEVAAEFDVPCIENKPLARALFATSEVGQPIPVEFFVAVAELLAFVYRARGVSGYGAMS